MPTIEKTLTLANRVADNIREFHKEIRSSILSSSHGPKFEKFIDEWNDFYMDILESPDAEFLLESNEIVTDIYRFLSRLRNQQNTLSWLL